MIKVILYYNNGTEVIEHFEDYEQAYSYIDDIYASNTGLLYADLINIKNRKRRR